MEKYFVIFQRLTLKSVERHRVISSIDVSPSIPVLRCLHWGICDSALLEIPMSTTSLAEQLEKDLLERHGPMIAGDALRIALGYPSLEALRQAVSRNTVPVPTFKLPHRRGRFALVKDLAAWLAQQRTHAQQDHPAAP